MVAEGAKCGVQVGAIIIADEYGIQYPPQPQRRNDVNAGSKTTKVAIKAGDLVKEALILSDSAGFSLAAIHLSEALAAIEQEQVLVDICAE